MSKELREHKEELLEAVMHYTPFNLNQRKILRVLLEVEINNKSVIDVKTIAKLVKTTTTAVYNSIKLFKANNLLSVIEAPSNKIHTFLIHQSEIEDLKTRALAIKKRKIT